MKRKQLSLLLCIAMLLSVLSACTSNESGLNAESDTPKVSDSQIEFDMPDLLEYLDDEEDFPRTEYYDHWEAVQHTYNEDMHTDTVQLNLYYSYESWLVSYKLYTVNLVYQYSRDNDLWTLIGNNGAEYIKTEYQPDLADKLEGRYAKATERDENLFYDDTTITVSASIKTVDTAAETMVIEYAIYQDGKLICNEREAFDFEVVFFYWGFTIGFNYTLTDSRGSREPLDREGGFLIEISEDSMDLSISLG